MSFKDVQYAFARHIRDPERAAPPADIEPRRMKVYRELFLNNLSTLLAGTYPVLHAILGEARWAALIRDFMVRHEDHTPLFPEVPQELLRFMQETRWADGVPHPDDPPFLLELAHYEWVELALQLFDDPVPDDGIDPQGDLLQGRPVLSALAWPLAYRWPVHRLSAAYQPATPPEAPTFLVVYRDGDDQVRFMEVNVVTARLLDLVGDGSDRLTGQEMLDRIALEMTAVGPEAVQAGGAQTLALLRQQGILRGTRR